MSFQVGDQVWDVVHGEGIVTALRDESYYLILVTFPGDGGIRTYTAEGRYSGADLYPALYHYGTEIIPAPEPVRCPFKKYDRVLVRDFSGQAWKITLFKSFHPVAETDHKYHTYGCPSCGGDDTSIFCIPFEGNEHLIGTNEEA